MTNNSIGASIWSKLQFKDSARPDTLEKYRVATIAWLDDLDVKSPIDKFGISQGTYRKYMNKSLVTELPLMKENSDWKLKLFSCIELRPCGSCGLIRDLLKDYSKGQKTCKYCQQEYRDINKDHHKEYLKEHYKANIGEYKHRAALRKAKLLQATPQWADLLAIKEIYDQCPTGCHVDHIIPLQGETVCGLHVEYNLRHLEASLNIAKSNKLIEELIYGK